MGRQSYYKKNKICRFLPLFMLTFAQYTKQIPIIVSELLKNLNPAQKAAVINFDTPSLIVAGAGSGKTRVLTSRIAYMLEQGVEPYRILALTFTNKAAAEMRERIGQMVTPEQSQRLWMGTFHSIFLKILRVESQTLGYPSSFTIYDTADSKNLLKSILKDMNLGDDAYKPNVIFSRISLAKNNLVTPGAWEANTTYMSEDRERKIPEFVNIYKAYMRRCKENGAMDFDDMLLNINILFRDFPETLAKYQQRFSHILVDEYQDTNYAQYIIIRRLAQLHSKVCVVGDDAQSIYSFRGAKIENILRFKNDFPGAQIFKLEQNYRSTKTIVNAANSVIEKNTKQIKKESFSDGANGDKIKVIKAYTDQEEASMVADELRNRIRSSGADWSETALLYRTNMQSRVFEEAFRRRGIPYRIYGGMSFYQRKEIKDVLGYLHLVINPRDDEAFKRIINYPSRGIGDVTVGKIGAAALEKGLSYWEALDTLSADELGLKGAGANKVREFTSLIRSLAGERTTLDLYKFAMEVATRSGIIGSYKIEQTPEAQSALDNIEELLNSIQVFSDDWSSREQYDQITGEVIEGESIPASIEEWLQSVTLLTDMDEQKGEDNNKVTLMTVHAAKGLEYRYVFIVGMEENLFPSLMSLDGADGLEEERRLFYVALTRAKEAAVLSFSETRFKWGTTQFCSPSRFLSEIGPEFLELTFDMPSQEESDMSPIDKLKRNYNEGTIERGAAARRWHSPKEAGTTQTFRPKSREIERVETPQPQVGEGTRFKKVGARIIDKQEQATLQQSSIDASLSATPVAGGLQVGDTVEHAKFGRGTVSAVEQLSSDIKITVNFPEWGAKTLLSKFARLTKIS